MSFVAGVMAARKASMSNEAPSGGAGRTGRRRDLDHGAVGGETRVGVDDLVAGLDECEGGKEEAGRPGPTTTSSGVIMGTSRVRVT